MHTMNALPADGVLALAITIVSLVGIVCALVAIDGVLRRGWSVERMLLWLIPVTTSEAMDAFGLWPLAVGAAILAAARLARAVDRKRISAD